MVNELMGWEYIFTLMPYSQSLKLFHVHFLIIFADDRW